MPQIPPKTAPAKNTKKHKPQIPMRSRVVAFAELWLPIFGAGICIAWAIGAWYGDNKILAIWLIFAGAICLLLLGTLQWQHAIEASEKPNIEIDKARAYVFIEQIETMNIDDDLMTIHPTKIAHVNIVIKNSGQTPAIRVKHRASIRFAAFPPPADLFSPPPNIQYGSVFTLPSGGRASVTAGLGRALNDSEKTILGLGTHAVYVFGEISYDTFGQRRCTHYRYMVGGNVGFHDGRMAQMAEGNEIDVNCTQ
jgi:hypothetical protein